MKKKQVPQDNSDVYQGQKKLLYAVNDEGHYQGVQSSGWEVETFATKLAVEALEQQAQQALKDANAGKVSPLMYHMLSARHDVLSLAQATGFFQWQVKRHLTPKVFNKLNRRKLLQYADVLSITVEQLQELPHEHE